MGERRGTKALELWCRRITEGYPGVNIQNMTTSWKDGLAFCAMIHHFRPDLIDFDSLNKDDVYGNNELAFRTAEQHLGIPALLDAEDMASCTVPDRLSILTYISQFYQSFGGSSPSRLATNRTTETTNERIGPVPESPKNKVGSRLGMRRDPCTACGLPVFLAEKLLVDRAPYHRTCFRCARCGNQLTPGNYYETEEGRYCCETCPDEVTSSSPEVTHRTSGRLEEDLVTVSGYQRSLSDEEKVLEGQRRTPDVAIPDLISQTSRLRLDFMASHMLTEKTERNEILGKENSENQKSITSHATGSTIPETRTTARINSAFPDDDDRNEEGDKSENEEEKGKRKGEEENQVDLYQARSKTKCTIEEKTSLVNKMSDVEDKKNSTRLTAIPFHDTTSDKCINVKKSEGDDTKDEEEKEEQKSLSLVQQRLKMFEDRGTKRSPDVSDSTVPSQIRPDRPISSFGSRRSLEENLTKESKHPFPCEDEARRSLEISSSSSIVSPNSIEEAATPKSFEGKEIFSDEESKSDPIAETSLIRAKGIDLSSSSSSAEYPEDLNPFKSDDDEEEVGKGSIAKVSTNPFGSDDDEDEENEREKVPPKPAVRSNVTTKSFPGQIVDLPVKIRLPAPHINLNPFWSDDEEDHDSLDLDDHSKEKKTSLGNAPVPKPRTIKTTGELGAAQRKSELNRGGMYSSNSSIKSSESSSTPGGTCRKKKPAPQPPTSKESFSPERRSSMSESFDKGEYRSASPRTTPRARKTKPAPPPPPSPPLSSSTPQNLSIDVPSTLTESPDVIESGDAGDKHRYSLWEDQKTNKDEANRNRQGLVGGYTDKSVHGKWKRKKGPAPPRPIPHRRKIKVMSMKDVKLELDEIELQQQGLERQGVRLEQLIRDKCESGQRNEESSLSIDVEELVLELFALVNEKNELFRRQAELMLLRRQQRLEEEHAEVEFQIRCLMCQSEATKTDFDKQREEALIQRLIEIVERRNEIVECLEMDRRREIEEDKSIHKHMDLFAARNKNGACSNNSDLSKSSKSKKGKIKEKLKEKKFKKSTKKDADKDVDETEVKLKRHKKKWF